MNESEKQNIFANPAAAIAAELNKQTGLIGLLVDRLTDIDNSLDAISTNFSPGFGASWRDRSDSLLNELRLLHRAVLAHAIIIDDNDQDLSKAPKWIARYINGIEDAISETNDHKGGS
jgi:hypothetical protein